MDFSLDKLLESLDRQKESIKAAMQETSEAYRRVSTPGLELDKLLKPVKVPTLKERSLELDRKYGLPEGLLYAIAATEVGTVRDAINVVNRFGAAGIMQQKPDFRKDWKVNNPHNPIEAMEGTARALAHYYDLYDGNLDKIIAAYNWGPTSLRTKGLSNAPKQTKDYIENVRRLLAHKTPLRIPIQEFHDLMNTPITKWTTN